MKNVLILFSLLTFISFSSYGQKEHQHIQSVIVRFFDGLSLLNNDSLRVHTTTDFLLLENGKVENLDSLINRISHFKNTSFQLVNTITFIRTEQIGAMAWVSYYNTGAFKINNEARTINWLESAVLVKIKDQWKISMLHSTIINK